jgi:hypothetical protein
MALMTIRGQGQKPPSYESAASQLGVTIEDIDHSFGIVLLDPAKSLYAVQARADRIRGSNHSRYRGPFSNPRIGPVRSRD